MAEMDNVSKKILEDAQKERQKILDQAREKAKKIIAEARKDKQEALDQAKNKAQQKYKQAYELEMIKAKSEAQQKRLLSKLELVDQTVEQAKKKILDSKQEDYRQFIKKGIQDLDIKQGSYIIGRQEEKLDHDTVRSLSKNIKLEKSDHAPDFDRGLKIISQNKEYLLSPETIIDTQMEDLKMEIADFLFGEEK